MFINAKHGRQSKGGLADGGSPASWLSCNHAPSAFRESNIHNISRELQNVQATQPKCFHNERFLSSEMEKREREAKMIMGIVFPTLSQALRWSQNYPITKEMRGQKTSGGKAQPATRRQIEVHTHMWTLGWCDDRGQPAPPCLWVGIVFFFIFLTEKLLFPLAPDSSPSSSPTWEVSLAHQDDSRLTPFSSNFRCSCYLRETEKTGDPQALSPHFHILTSPRPVPLWTLLRLYQNLTSYTSWLVAPRLTISSTTAACLACT